ncbi:MAG: cytochrome c oxidase accessory protein CcoG [Deltaproteobacteria bacterium]|nr:cytochrome c oxidase accessory protein CcoG [Deltaproteobacteria bacterium]
MPASKIESSAPDPTGFASDVALYAKRRKIYQREAHGKFQQLRTVTLFVLAGFFLAVPWFNWHGRQAVWFDLPQRKFHLVVLTFWPQDFIYLSWLLIIAAMSLLFFTTLAGRLWCGYACPQTVWTKFYMWIEWLTEGDRNARIRLDRGPWTRDKLVRGAAKHFLWLVLAFAVGISFVGYFDPLRSLLSRLATLQLTVTEMIAVAVASLALYFDAGFMREQICLYACPYARFQGAMFDTSTLTIFYDRERGEPRGHRNRKDAGKGLGDCVDCHVCVDVCPTGIDIRNGTQYQCIGCAACIDACDEVMDKVGSSRGLVRYATEESLAGKEVRILRPRLIAYGSVLTIMIVAFTYGLSQRIPLRLDILRDRARVFRVTSEGLIENVYTLKIMNMDEQDHSYRIGLADGHELRLVAPATVFVQAGQIAAVPVRLQAEPDEHEHERRARQVTFTVQADDQARLAVRGESRFLMPAGGST